MATFDNIKVGDKVIYTSAWGNDVVATVTKVTKAGNFATDKTYKTLWNKYGRAYGGDKWDTSRIIEYSEEYVKAMNESIIITRAVDMMRRCSKSDLTIEQAKAIIEILKERSN